MNEISGFFFLPLWRGKKNGIISHREKNPRYFFPKRRLQTEKKQRYFSKLLTPIYFCQNCEIQIIKLTSYFGQNWGSQTEIKRYRPYFSKNCVFQAEAKNTYYFCQNRQEILQKK